MKPVIWMCLLSLGLISSSAHAARISDIANTKHNLSSTWGGAVADNRVVKASSEVRICVFCHTPHAAENITGAPLWNRKLGSSSYTMYDSSSMDATKPTAPSNSSKICLSCHDGTLAVGAVNVLNGSATDQDPVTEDITMIGTGTNGVMANGSGVTTGYTRNIGVDLSNDHPISITYDSALAAADGELRDPSSVAHIDVRTAGVRPVIPLVKDSADNQNKIECVSCHDPHVRDDTGEDIKFLRLNRFQTTADPSGTTFNESNDIICLGCHSKEGWVDSAHANSAVADETYNTTAATQRGFPNALPVWRAACLNCHDTHTVQGSRRLLREGTDSTSSPKAGGNPAIEETCYQCHSGDGGTLNTQGYGTQVPDIKGDFLLARRMPITNTDQNVTTEKHDIGSSPASNFADSILAKDFVESYNLLGRGGSLGTVDGLGQGNANYVNRHVECTDCHNPHRVIKNRVANAANPSTPSVAGTHDHNATPHNNIISGVLRGAWGVDVYMYNSANFYDKIMYYIPKKGMPAPGGLMTVDQDYVTREYQICFKCHSSYAYDDQKITGANAPPQLGLFGGGTPSGTNGLTNFTNQAREFQAPATHAALTGSPGDSGAAAGFTANNRRSWHPVMAATGRSAVRGHSTLGPDMTSSFLSPWNAGVGSQTMYCSDCHGSNTANGTAVPTGGEDGNPWGPHGSSNDFILKGSYSTGYLVNGGGMKPDANTVGSGKPDAICFKCHDYNAYAGPTSNYGNELSYNSGFSGDKSDGTLHFKNLHLAHVGYLGKLRCNWCHVAVPHGWKNKALLVNLNDVGPEATCTTVDLLDGHTCTNGQPFPVGSQVRLGPAPDPDGDTTAYKYWNQGGGSDGKGYNNPPYYRNAVLKIASFANSGQWKSDNCGTTNYNLGGGSILGMCTTGGKWAFSDDGCSSMP